MVFAVDDIGIHDSERYIKIHAAIRIEIRTPEYSPVRYSTAFYDLETIGLSFNYPRVINSGFYEQRDGHSDCSERIKRSVL